MEVIVYLVLGLSIWILVPSERSTLLGRAAERSAQREQRPPAEDDADEAPPDLVVDSRDR